MRAIVAIAVALLLTACNSITQDKVDATIDRSFPVVCAGINVAFLGWQAANPKVDPKLSAKIGAAYVTAEGICLNPPKDTAEALAAAVKAYSDFNAALRAAKNGTGTTSGSAG